VSKQDIAINELTSIVVDRCVKIHSKIGPGCFEKVYDEILCYELIKIGLNVDRQVLLPLKWEGICMKNAYKLDLLVENMLVLEQKSVHPLPPVYFKQVKTHLSLMGLKHGMLLNFKVELMKNGIYRVYNNRGAERL
jgi:GxxExxY protein